MRGCPPDSLCVNRFSPDSSMDLEQNLPCLVQVGQGKRQRCKSHCRTSPRTPGCCACAFQEFAATITLHPAAKQGNVHRCGAFGVLENQRGWRTRRRGRAMEKWTKGGGATELSVGKRKRNLLVRGSCQLTPISLPNSRFCCLSCQSDLESCLFYQPPRCH